MTRLINNQGTWQIQIDKTDHKAICIILSDMPNQYLEVVEKDETTFTFEFSSWDYDGPDRSNEYEYRYLLSKICDNPDPDLIIPIPYCEPSPLQKELSKFNFMDSQLTRGFLENVGRIENPQKTTFEWKE